MTPLTVFFRTLLKSSAIFIGAGYVMLHPSLDLRSGARSAVTAQKSPAEAAIDALITALKDSDAGVRRQAASALGQRGSRRAVPALIELLKDSLPEVRQQRARRRCTQIGDPPAAPALVTRPQGQRPAHAGPRRLRAGRARRRSARSSR